MAAREVTDEQLVTASTRDALAFGVFYRRHAEAVLGFFASRVRDPEVAADLTAETFAKALQHCARFDPAIAPARAWLFGIAHRELAIFWERGRVEQRGRRRMRIARPALEDEDLERVEQLVSIAAQGSKALALMGDLPVAQRDAVVARVVEERPYQQIAATASLSEANIRQRVARGLAAIRARMGDSS